MNVYAPTLYVPTEWLYESSPAAQECTTDFLHTENGQWFLRPKENEVNPEDCPHLVQQLTHGQVIEFTPCRTYGLFQITVADDKSFTVAGDLPADANRFWEPDDRESYSDTIEEAIGWNNLSPGTHELYAMFSGDPRHFRFETIDGDGNFYQDFTTAFVEQCIRPDPDATPITGAELYRAYCDFQANTERNFAGVAGFMRDMTRRKLQKSKSSGITMFTGIRLENSPSSGRCKMSTRLHPMKAIPVSAAEHIAKTYGYDQVIIVARRVGEAPEPFGEHMTTYGRNKEHCAVAAAAGKYLQEKVMGWHAEGGEQ